MEENKVSRTALFAAYIRAYHAMHDSPIIFDDHLAYHLFTEAESIEMGQNLAEALKFYDPEHAVLYDQATAQAEVIQFYAGGPLFLSRSRYTEDNLEKALRQGVQQYVILGAGMDTFAFRRKEMLEQLKVFEVDHPATQSFKCHRINELGWEQPKNLHFVPIDFTQENLAEVLTRSSYDPKIPSFFSWLGVTYYLTRDTVFTTLRSIADIAPVGSAIIFDYLHADAFIPERTSKRLQLGMELLRRIGEPNITGFEPSRLATDLAPINLRLYENLSPTDIEGRYFQGRKDGYHASEHMHFAWAAVE